MPRVERETIANGPLRIPSSQLENAVLRRLPEITRADSPTLIHIGGISAAGKSTQSRALVGTVDASLFTMDSYLKGWDYVNALATSVKGTGKPFYGWDDPGNFDLETIGKDLVEIRKGGKIQQPIFDRASGKRVGYQPFAPTQRIIVEGVHALNPEIAKFADLKIAVTASLHDRFIRRLLRDSLIYEMPIDEVVKEYLLCVEPAYIKFAKQNEEAADIIADNPLHAQEESSQYAPVVKDLDERDCIILTPKFTNGRSSEEELLAVSSDGTRPMLEYWVGNNHYIHAPVEPETVRLMTEYYDYAQGYLQPTRS